MLSRGLLSICVVVSQVLLGSAITVPEAALTRFSGLEEAMIVGCWVLFGGGNGGCVWLYLN